MRKFFGVLILFYSFISLVMGVIFAVGKEGPVFLDRAESPFLYWVILIIIVLAGLERVGLHSESKDDVSP